MMKYLNVVFCVLLSNNFLCSMEIIESKKVTWRVDKEIQFDFDDDSSWAVSLGKNFCLRAFFSQNGKEIIAIPRAENCFACRFDRSTGEELERVKSGVQEEEEQRWLKIVNESCNAIRNISKLQDEEKKATWEKWCEERSSWHNVKIFDLLQERCALYSLSSKDVYIWDVKEQKESLEIKCDRDVESVGFNPKGMEIIVTSKNAMQLFDGNTGKELYRYKFDYNVFGKSGYFNVEGTEIVVATSDGKIRVLVQEIEK